MCLLTEHFVKFKIRHIFIMLFGGYFVKFYSRQIFRPYGMTFAIDISLMGVALITKRVIGYWQRRAR